MIITLTGANDYEVEQQRRTLEGDFVTKNGRDSVSHLSGETTEINELRSAVQSVSLFTPNTMVILSNPSGNKNLFNGLEDIIGLTPESTALIITDGVLDKRTRVYKRLQKDSEFHEYNILDEPTALKWVIKQTEQRGGSITTSAARSLIEKVGTNQWQLTQEIEKLIAYDKSITGDSIKALVVPNLEAHVFEVLDVVFRHDEERSRHMIEELKAVADPYEFFGLLVWQVNSLALVVSATSEKGQGSVAVQTGLKPYTIQKIQSLKTTPEMAKEFARQVADLDVRMKSGADPWSAIEQALLRIASQAAV